MRSSVHPPCRMAEVLAVRPCPRLLHPAVLLVPRTPPRVIAELPDMKLRLPEPDVNGRFDRRDELCVSPGDTEHTEQRTDHGAVTMRLHALGQQQARPGAIFRRGLAVLRFDGHHRNNLLVHVVDTRNDFVRAYVTLLPCKTARAYALGHRCYGTSLTCAPWWRGQTRLARAPCVCDPGRTRRCY